MQMLSILIDPKLLPWVFVLNVAGIWLKRGKNKLPSWMFPIPVLLCFISIIICTIFGLIENDVNSARDMAKIIFEYAITNGLVMTLAATWGYDIFHAYLKKEYV